MQVASVGLAAEIAAAKRRAQIEAWEAGERAMAAGVASQLEAPKLEIDEALRGFVSEWTRWCGSRSVRYLPAAPATVAGWLLEHKDGRRADIFAMLDAIALIHGMNGRSDPTSTPIARAALAHIIPEITAPRSWDAASKVAFHRLPADVQAVINRREHDRELYIRRRQNELAEKLKSLPPDEPKAVTTKEEV